MLQAEISEMSDKIGCQHVSQFIDHMPEVFKAVIDANGSLTSY
jgi:hypothetical protein